MYIKKVEITNIRSIEKFEMTFDAPAGWHVLIGDNGSGKSSIVRSISLALIGYEQVLGLGRKSEWIDWSNWLRQGETRGEILLEISTDWRYDFIRTSGNIMGEQTNPPKENLINSYGLVFENISYPRIVKNDVITVKSYPDNINSPAHPRRWNWNTMQGWFSVAFGPNRKFIGGEESKEDSQYAQLIAHLTLFDESASLIDSIAWLKQKKFEQLEGRNNHFDQIKELINSSHFLPYNATLNEVNSESVMFIDGNGLYISIDQLSDGFMSMVGLFLELMRHLIVRYNINIFSKNNDGEIFVTAPGVVLIDEVDAHLHPTWQTRIGQWFTKYFPNIQFIVTTHSPLVCRASEKGSIWRLAAPGSEMKSEEVKGTDRNRLIFGNVLDAYGTEIFGEDVSQSANAEEMLKELADLNLKSFKGTISDTEKERVQQLKTILPTE